MHPLQCSQFVQILKNGPDETAHFRMILSCGKVSKSVSAIFDLYMKAQTSYNNEFHIGKDELDGVD